MADSENRNESWEKERTGKTGSFFVAGAAQGAALEHIFQVAGLYIPVHLVILLVRTVLSK